MVIGTRPAGLDRLSQVSPLGNFRSLHLGWGIDLYKISVVYNVRDLILEMENVSISSIEMYPRQKPTKRQSKSKKQATIHKHTQQRKHSPICFAAATESEQIK